MTKRSRRPGIARPPDHSPPALERLRRVVYDVWLESMPPTSPGIHPSGGRSGFESALPPDSREGARMRELYTRAIRWTDELAMRIERRASGAPPRRCRTCGRFTEPSWKHCAGCGISLQETSTG